MFQILEFIPKMLAWLQIVMAPTAIAAIAGFFIYACRTDIYGLIIGIAIAAIGFISGVIWATIVWRKRGTVEFMAKVVATPELDAPSSAN